jgi:hypothetical protein
VLREVLNVAARWRPVLAFVGGLIFIAVDRIKNTVAARFARDGDSQAPGSSTRYAWTYSATGS